MATVKEVLAAMDDSVLLSAQVDSVSLEKSVKGIAPHRVYVMEFDSLAGGATSAEEVIDVVQGEHFFIREIMLTGGVEGASELAQGGFVRYPGEGQNDPTFVTRNAGIDALSLLLKFNGKEIAAEGGTFIPAPAVCGRAESMRLAVPMYTGDKVQIKGKIKNASDVPNVKAFVSFVGFSIITD